MPDEIDVFFLPKYWNKTQNALARWCIDLTATTINKLLNTHRTCTSDVKSTSKAWLDDLLLILSSLRFGLDSFRRICPYPFFGLCFYWLCCVTEKQPQCRRSLSTYGIASAHVSNICERSRSLIRVELDLLLTSIVLIACHAQWYTVVLCSITINAMRARPYAICHTLLCGCGWFCFCFASHSVRHPTPRVHVFVCVVYWIF